MENLLLLIIILLPLSAQCYIMFTYNKNLKRNSKSNITGFDVARQILDKNNLEDVLILETNGVLTDHYNPSRKVIKLSKNIYESTSISSLAVAAHEVGHAIQDKENYIFLKIRSLIFPVVNLTSRFSFIILILGFILESMNLITIGIITIGIGILFELITLPVEFNASRRALKELEDLNLTDNSDKKEVRNVLTAAALTYVASVVAEILQLIRLINIYRD